jgi:UDP-2,3-diacylglucosamine pyrophosphatase LpxH
VEQINGVLYCNDGDWVEHCTALVEDRNGELRIWEHRSAEAGLVRLPTGLREAA